MQYFTTLSTALTALLAIGVAGVPVPAQTQPNVPCPSTSLKQKQSTVFGWQLAGSAANDIILDDTCNLLSSGNADKWGQIGYDIPKIQAPVCNALSPNATTALPKVAAANTKAFTTLITNAFPKSNKAAFSYLCDNIRYDQLAGFLLNDAVIVNATCQLGNDQLNPQPFTSPGGAQPNITAIAEYKDANSRLFAYLYAAQANTAQEAGVLCAGASTPVRMGKWDDLELSGSCVKNTVCSVKEPISVEVAKEQVKTWTSKGFATVLANISNAPGYKKWLCENLDVESMDTVGMDGNMVKQDICSRIVKV